MHEKQEISEGIDILFQLEKEEFNPEVHFGLADQVVNSFGDQEYSFRFHDVFEANQYEAERGRLGQYVTKPIGKLAAGWQLGWRPKIEVLHWKDKIFGTLEYCGLLISYKGNQSTGIMKFEMEGFSLELPGNYLRLTYRSAKELWLFNR